MSEDDLIPYDPHRDDAETIDVTPAEVGAPVDRPRRPVTFAAIVTHTDERRPIVPATLRTAAGRHAMLVWATAATTHGALYHLSRSPKYAGRIALYAPRGAFRAVARPVAWATAEQGNWALRQAAATTGDAKTWLQLDARRQRQSSWRWPLLLVLAVAFAAAVVAMRLLVPEPAWWLFVALVVIAAAHLGKPLDRPILDRVFIGERFIRLTADMTRAALVACGAKIKDPAAVQFVRDISREGPGHMAAINLPPGVIATDVVDRREYLAGAFRLPLDQVWPEAVRGEHPGRLHIWVADRPVNSMTPPPWPLIRTGETDFFKSVPYGYDVRQRPVDYVLAERNGLFAGVPGSGKTLAARTVVLGAILDPLVVPLALDLKGNGDLECIAPLCPSGGYAAGADEGTKDAGMAMLAWLLKECDERPALINKYAKQGMNTTNKVNRKMAERDPRLRPIVVILDEIQELITDKERGKQATAMLTSIIKRGRALGIHLILATQRIDDKSLPKGISSNVTNRCCLAVASHVEVDLVLGTGAYGRGARPTAFLPGDDAGWGYRAVGTWSEAVRASYLDNAAAAQIVARAIAMRSGVGHEEMPVRAQVRNLLEDVRRVWLAGEAAMWSELIVPALKELDPDVYGDLTVEIFGSLMAAAGVPTVDIGRRIDGKATTRKGVKLPALVDRIKAREITD